MQFLSFSFYLWGGIIIGVSFIATPVKFLAPNLSLAQTLSVGRVTFKALSIVEGVAFLLVTLLLLALFLFKEKLSLTLLLPVFAIAMVLAIQYLWINPILDMRLLKIIDGETVEKSNLHQIYIFLEGMKLMLILYCGFLFKVQS
jgi:hypothetical protein